MPPRRVGGPLWGTWVNDADIASFASEISIVESGLFVKKTC